MAQQIDQQKIIALTQYNLKRVFTKPVKIDALLACLSEILQITFIIDESPGIVEVHVNEDILFVEIAKGLNRDKLDLLRFKIMELIELCAIKIPKIIIMLSDMTLNFADAPNLLKLFHEVAEASGAQYRNIRVLTRDDFTKKFIKGQSKFSGIEVVSNLQYAIDGLLANVGGSIDREDKKAELIGDKLLSSGAETGGEAMQLRFDAETRPKNMDADAVREFLQDLNIAAVDDDFTTLEIIKSIFAHVGVTIKTFSSGSDFLAAIEKQKFDLVFLDLVMSGMDGFSVLNVLSGNNIQIPVIVLSAITQRDTVLKVFRQGIKSYITKPFMPNVIINKTIEILRPLL
jgi:CheY-like chemotaxis protein